MAAHEDSEHAARAQEHGVGEATFEQLRADLARLARESDTGQPLTVFLDLRQVRERAFRLLERRLWPGEQSELHFALGIISGLMGLATARQAIAAAHQARARGHHDKVLDLGGEFAVTLATHHYLAGAALSEIRGAEGDATAETEEAVRLYQAGPGPGEDHYFGTRALASAGLAVLRLRAGALDAAADALEPVLALPPAQRVASLTSRLAVVRAGLAAPPFRGSPSARELDARIEQFSRDSLTAGLHALPGGPA